MNKNIKRIAINTGGGDAPGLNAVIHAAVYAARGLGWEIFGIREGYEGVLEPQNYPDGGLMKLGRDMVRNIAHLGGTILGTTNRGNPFKIKTTNPDGTVVEKDRSEEVIRRLREHQIDALISVGGDGSLTIAHQLSQKGLTVVGVPKTIDNDLQSTVVTFGFDSAVSFATECIDRLHATAESHRRVNRRGTTRHCASVRCSCRCVKTSWVRLSNRDRARNKRNGGQFCFHVSFPFRVAEPCACTI